MKNFIGSIILVISAVIIFSCGMQEQNYTVEEINGVKYFKNNGEPNGTYSPEATLLFEITGPQNVPDSMTGFGNIVDVIADSDNNIYILDGEHATIKKYNRNGEFERYFPEQTGGTELQHMISPSQFALLNDTLIIIDTEAKKYLRFLSNGSFINSSLRLMGGGMFLNMNSDGKNYLTAFVPQPDVIDSIDYFTNNLSVLDHSFKPKYVIKHIKTPYDKNFFFPEILTSYNAKNDLFYIAENENAAYRIFVINGRGHLKYVVEKKNEKITYDEYEKELLNEFVKSSGFPPINMNKDYYKKPINSIHIDKNNRLWVQPSLVRNESNKNSLYIDVFKEGVYINRILLDFVKPNESYKLYQDRLFVISEDRKSIRVYDYE